MFFYRDLRENPISPTTRALCFLIPVVFFCGCTFLPSSGPSAFRIKQGSKSFTPSGYEVVMLDENSTSILQRNSPKPAHLAADGRPTDSFFAARGLEKLPRAASRGVLAGDLLGIWVYETGGGLFNSLPAGAGGTGAPLTVIPQQRVDSSGAVTVPYVGRIQVIGKFPWQLEDEITEKLKQKTVDPQVIVAVANSAGGDIVSVGGDVKSPVLLPVSLSGTRLIDAITAAGGSLARPHQTMVTVTRNGHSRSDSLQDVFDRASKNIPLQPKDTVLLRSRPLNFLVFGAGGQVASVPIDVEDLTLAEAVARTGGPNDNKANPAAVFVFRREPRGVLERLGRTNIPPGDFVSVIYQLNLLRPEGFFIARNFNVRDKDILYYSSSSSVGVLKFMSLLTAFFAPARSGFTTAAGAEVF